MLSSSGRPSPPNPLGVGVLASPTGFDLVVVFVWAPPAATFTINNLLAIIKAHFGLALWKP